ncbi:MAG: cation-transporting P-type ATPase [Patescibacteria group bacterium]
MKEVNWASLSGRDILEKLHVREEEGLSHQEFLNRRHAVGVNALAKEKKLSAVVVFFSQFKSALIYILLVAAGISLFLQHSTDAWVILAAVILNVVVGFFQEIRAERALQALKQIVTFTCRVVREGKEQALDPTELVPGDIVKLKAGLKVPADVRILEAHDLAINESTLTGESVPVKKQSEKIESAVVITDKKNMAFFGSIVVAGSAVGVVVATGLQTEIGHISKLLATTEREETPLQAKLKKFSQTIATLILGVSLVLFVLGVVLGYDFVLMFTTAVALAVAAIPEGLVVVLTVILALGMQRILQQHALVRKLVAAETLGSTSVICTDKTGTLTMGEMHVVRILTGDYDATVGPAGESLRHPESVFKALRFGLLASDAYLENPDDGMHAWRVYGEPTERALVAAAAKFGFFRTSEEKEFPRVDVVPFNSDRKFMITKHTHNGESFMIFKGAPELLLKAATTIERRNKIHPLSKDDRHDLQRMYQKLSAEGLRILGVGYRTLMPDMTLPNSQENLEGLTFLGFFCFQDPVREDVKATIAETVRAGIRTVMLTGDNKLTAQAIAREIGLPSANENIIDGEALEKLSQEELDKRIADFSVYARVTPKDKLRIIDAWQHKGKVVAMTGDGVNDAPALKSANIGIALGSGTDVAKETADIVLLENNFAVIVHAIEEGRVIFTNIKKVILYLMSDSFTEMILISLAMFFGLPIPLLASQILWVNLVSDGLPALAMTVERKETQVMSDVPVARGEPLFTPRMRKSIFLISILTGLGALVVFYSYWKITGDVDRARTVTFLAVSIDSLVYVFSVRVLQSSFFRQNFTSNPWLLGAIFVALCTQLASVYVPFFRGVMHTVIPQGLDWVVVCIFALIGTTTFEILKWVYRRKKAGHVI